jgi:hypothetical protein
MKKLQTIIASALMVLGVGLVPVFAAPVVGATAKTQLCQGATGNNSCTKAGEETNLKVIIANVVNILLFIVGAVSVIMIVVGGLRYVTSGGDNSAVTSAKNTILYAVVGIVVAFMAYAIVNFVVMQLP